MLVTSPISFTDRLAAGFLAGLAGLAAGYAGILPYLFLGLLTHVFDGAAAVAAWWLALYGAGAALLILPAALAARWTYRWYLRRDGDRSRLAA